MRILVKIEVREGDPKLLESLHRATLPDDMKPPRNYAIAHEVGEGRFTYSAVYEGSTSSEAVRTASSIIEEFLRIYRMLSGTILEHRTQ
ncbi:MAG: hypothetical protein QXS42_04735 [Zestosphaera sp.]